LSPDKGKVLEEIDIRAFSTGQQITIHEKRRVMNELLLRYPENYRRLYTGGRSAALWFSVEDGESLGGFNKEDVHWFLKEINSNRDRTERWLEVFEHYFIEPNKEMNPVSERGIAPTVKLIKELHLAFKDILERVRKEG
jgi:hypothetical protein